MIPSGNFTIQGRLGIGTLGADPQRSFMWTLTVPQELIKKVINNSPKNNSNPVSKFLPSNIKVPSVQSLGGLSDKLLAEEDFLIKCRSATIPSKVMDDISTHFYGQKRVMPLKVSYSNVLECEFIETERQTFKKFFDEWMTVIYDANFRSNNFAANRSLSTSDYMTNLILSFKGYSGIPLDKNITFFNCWPKNINEVNVRYDGSEAIKYVVSFSFDYWQLEAQPLINIPRIF